jgi:HK97 family phage major capsid protein/HK97 family phage prohead protease
MLRGMDKHPQKTIRPGTKVARALTVDRAAINEEARTVELSFSSETPYERYWGVEVLDHAPGAMRLGRLKTGGPLLMDHDSRDHVGVIESVQIGEDRVGRAVVRFGKGARAEEIFRDVVDGIRRNVSVGYAIHKAVLVEIDKDSDVGTYRVTDWEPYEISLVSVPADATVGVGRSAEESPLVDLEEPQTRSASPPILKGPVMDPVVDQAAIEKNTREAELARVSTIIAIGEQFAKQGGEKLASEALRSGLTVDQFRAKLMEKLSTEQPTPDIGLSDKETRQYSLASAIVAHVTGNWKAAGFEREVSQAIAKRMGMDPANGGFYVPYEVQKRDMTAAGASGSQYLVATNNLAGSFIELLRARSLVTQFGARMLPGLVGNVTIPKMTAASTAYWLSTETTAITESQPTIGQLSLTPKTVGAYTELSRQMLLQSTPAADMLVMDDFSKVLALGIDAAALNGSGASGQPTGIIGTSGIGSVTGTSIDYAKVLEFQTDVATGNALAATCGYMTTPAVAGLLAGRQRFSSTDTPLWEGNLLDGKVAGFRGGATTQMPSASMLFGDFSQVVIGEWGQLEIATTNSEGNNFKAGLIGIRAFQTVDIGVRQAAAFSYASSIT